MALRALNKLFSVASYNPCTLRPVQPLFHVSDRAREIVDTLKEVLECTVLLYDGTEGRMHLYRCEGSWMSFASAGIAADEEATGSCRADQKISDRWWLHLARNASMHPDVRRLAPWAAAALAKELPGTPQPWASALKNRTAHDR